MDNACWVGEKRECLPLGLSVLWGLVFHPVPEKGKIKSFDSQETLICSRDAFVMCCQICSDALTHALERKINNLIAALSGCPKALDSLNYLSAARAVWLLPPVYSSERVLSIRNASLPSTVHFSPSSVYSIITPFLGTSLSFLWTWRDCTPVNSFSVCGGVETILPSISGSDTTEIFQGATEADISKYEAAPEPNWRLEC